MTTIQRRAAVLTLRNAEPAITNVEIGKRLGIGEAAVRKHLRKMGVPAKCRCTNPKESPASSKTVALPLQIALSLLTEPLERVEIYYRSGSRVSYTSPEVNTI